MSSVKRASERWLGVCTIKKNRIRIQAVFDTTANLIDATPSHSMNVFPESQSRSHYTADERNRLVGVFTDGINRGQSEKPRG